MGSRLPAGPITHGVGRAGRVRPRERRDRSRLADPGHERAAQRRGRPV